MLREASRSCHLTSASILGLSVLMALCAGAMKVQDTPDLHAPLFGRTESEEAVDTIFVGGLHEELVKDDILCCFEQFGPVESASLPLRRDGSFRNRGFAFVRFQDPRSCELAIDNMHEVELAGKSLRIEAAIPQQLHQLRKQFHIQDDVDLANTDLSKVAAPSKAK